MKLRDRILYWLIIAACGAFSIWSVLMIPKEAWAADLTQEQARGILYVAYGQYHGPRSLIEDPPVVKLVDSATLCQRFDRHPHCGALGIYLGGENTILLDAALDFSTAWATAALVHEYVHHFQWKQRGNPKSCGEMTARERQAYLIQAELLERVGDINLAYRALKGAMVHNILFCPVDAT